MFKKVLLTLAHTCILFSIILTAIRLASFDLKFFSQEYKKLEVAQDIGVSFSDLMKATSVILDYTKNEREDMDCLVEINGSLRQFYNQREIDHMVDVKNLYRKAMSTRNVLVVIGLVIIGLFIKEKIEQWQALKTALFFVGVCIAAIAFFVIDDFDSFWTNFHYLVFANDLWLLNPLTDNLILMVPLTFFNDLVIRIFIYAIALVLLFCGACFFFFINRKGKSINES